MLVKLRYAFSVLLTVFLLILASAVIAYLMYVSGQFLSLHFTLLTNIILLFCFMVEKKYLPQAIFISVSIPVLGAVLVFYAVITYNRKTYRLQRNMQFLDEFKDEFLLFDENNSKNNKLFARSDLLYNEMLKDIKNAKKSVFIVSYIIEDGKALDKLVRVIKRLSLSVEVTIVVDYFGSAKLSRKTVKELRKLKVKVKYFNKPSLFITLADNLRMHAKFLAVDGVIGYFSSLNIGDRFLFKERDFGVRVENKNIINVENTFKRICKLSKTSKVKKKPKDKMNEQALETIFDAGYQALPLITFSDKLKNLYVCLLLFAKQKIRIISPYISIDDRLLEVFLFLVHAGVEIEIIVPSTECGKKRMGVNKFSCNDLLIIGVKVYSTKCFLHAKALIIDDKIALSGSANLDERSLSYAVESNLVIKDNRLIERLISIFDSTLVVATRLEKSKIKNNLIEGQKKNFSKLLSPLV